MSNDRRNGNEIVRPAPEQERQPDELMRHRMFLDARMSRIGQWVTQGVRPEALVRFALMDMDGEKGAKLRACTPQSVYLALLACAVTGLEPGSLRGEAYLVPYKNKGVMEASFMPGWRGIVKQARRSREIVEIWSNVVFENDEYHFDLGTAKYLVHKPAKRDRGEICAAYAIAKLASGGFEIETMDMDDLLAVRNAGANGPAWNDWADQMYRKAPIRRMGKRLPMGADYFVALALENAASDASMQRKVIEMHGEGRLIEDSSVAQLEAPSEPADGFPMEPQGLADRVAERAARTREQKS